jgi:hypothetical protein
MRPENPYEFSPSNPPFGAGGLRPARPLPTEMKHSGLGIASFVMAMGMGVYYFVLFVAAGVIAQSTQGEIDETSPLAMIVGLALMGGIMLDLLAIALGIAGMCQTQRKKVFAVLGVLIGTLILIGVVSLVAIGMAMNAAKV